MKRLNLQHIAYALLSCLFMASCDNGIEIDGTPTDNDLKNEYTHFWVRNFGLIDPSHSWCTVSSVTVKAFVDGDISCVEVYNGEPARGGHLIGRTTSGADMAVDMPDQADCVYCRCLNAHGSLIAAGYYPIEHGRVIVDGQPARRLPSLSRAASRAVTYAHDPSYFDAMICCEDLGSIGDFDFNDIVFGLRHISGDEPALIIVPMAAGGTIAANIYFKNSLVGEIHDLISEGSPYDRVINTQTANIGGVDRLPHLSADLSAYPGWTIAANWGDLRIEVTDKETTINITAPTPGTAPQMICLGGDWFWPREKVDIKTAYTGFETWNCNPGATTWLGGWVDNAVVKWDVPAPPDTRMWYIVTTTDNKPYDVRVNGSTTVTQQQSGTKYYVDEPWTSCKDMFIVYSESQAFVLNREGAYVLGNPVANNNVLTVEFSDGFDMTRVTTFEGMFNGCASLTSVNTGAWLKPTSALTDAYAMFRHCASLTALDLSGWDVSSVTSLYDAFSGCTSLRTLNLSGWTFATGADLRYFIENTNSLNITCPAASAARLRAVAELGGTGTTYTEE